MVPAIFLRGGVSFCAGMVLNCSAGLLTACGTLTLLIRAWFTGRSKTRNPSLRRVTPGLWDRMSVRLSAYPFGWFPDRRSVNCWSRRLASIAAGVSDLRAVTTMTDCGWAAPFSSSFSAFAQGFGDEINRACGP